MDRRCSGKCRRQTIPAGQLWQEDATEKRGRRIDEPSDRNKGLIASGGGPQLREYPASASLRRPMQPNLRRQCTHSCTKLFRGANRRAHLVLNLPFSSWSVFVLIPEKDSGSWDARGWETKEYANRDLGRLGVMDYLFFLGGG